MDTPTITCECGKHILRSSYKKHLKSAMHNHIINSKKVQLEKFGSLEHSSERSNEVSKPEAENTLTLFFQGMNNTVKEIETMCKGIQVYKEHSLKMQEEVKEIEKHSDNMNGRLDNLEEEVKNLQEEMRNLLNKK